MERALIFFDVDGTIVDDKGVVPKSTVSAIAAARKKGHICVVNTGRPLSHVLPTVKALGFDGYICSCGQYILMGEQCLLYRHPDTDFSRKMLKLIRACHMDVVFEGEQGIWFDHTRPIRKEVQATIEDFSRRGFDTNLPVDHPDFCFDKFCVWTNPDSDRRLFLETVQEALTVIDRGGDLLECVLPDCSKETGMRRVMEYTGVLEENCYAIGDSANDLPMLRAVPHGIAMGDAPEAVQTAAEYVTASLSMDGLKKALEHYGLI